jgi:hypothetical protein
VGEPFRDGLEAALERAERLADENEDLRDEVERLKHDAAAPPVKPANAAAVPPPDSQGERILHMLDDLAKERDSKPEVRIAEQLAPLAPTEPHAEQRIQEIVPDVVLEPKARARKLEEPTIERAREASVEDRVRGAWIGGIFVGFMLGVFLLIAVLLLTKR